MQLNTIHLQSLCFYILQLKQAISRVFSERYILILNICFLLLCPLETLASNVAIGVVIDGQSETTDRLMQQLKQELSELSGRDFIASFPAKYQLNSQWDVPTIKQNVAALANQPGIDIVLALGVISSQQTLSVHRAIPVIAPLVINNSMQRFPLTRHGSSGLNNLHYLTANYDFRREIAHFQTLTNAQNIALVMDDLLLQTLPESSKVISEHFKDAPYKVHIVSNKNGAS